MRMNNNGRLDRESNVRISRFVLALLILIPSSSSFTSAWQSSSCPLDSSFGAAGKLAVAVPGDTQSGFQKNPALVVDSQARLVVAGRVKPSDHAIFGVMRLLSDGTLDASFGVGGYVLLDFGVSQFFSSMIIQPDGRLVLVGSNNGIVLIRLNDDGSLDQSFGQSGLVTTQSSFTAAELALQADGSIVVIGTASGGAGHGIDVGVTRFTSSGQPDTTFGTNGLTLVDFSNGFNEEAAAVSVQTDGRIIACGTKGNAFDFALARLLSDGSLDSSFGTGGTVVTDLSGVGSVDSASAMTLQGDGKIVVGGGILTQTSTTAFDAAVARYNSDGSLDLGFGGSGRLFVDVAGGDDGVSSLAVQGDGKLVAALGTFNSLAGSTGTDMGALRINSDGSLDSTFGSSGKLILDIGGDSRDEADAVAIQQDGKIVLCGETTIDQPRSLYAFALVRYTGAGEPLRATTQPLDRQAEYGETVTLTTAGSGTPSPSIRWQRSTDGGNTFTNIGGATNSSLVLPSVKLSQHNYRYRAVLTNSCEVVTTHAAVLTVYPAVTSTVLESSSQATVYGDSVTFTATVTATFATPTGSVRFTDGTRTLGRVTLSGGVATLTPATLAAGDHTILASYLGNANFEPSEASVEHSVSMLATTTTFSTSPNPSAFREAVTLSATVSAGVGAPTPTGTVRFYDGTTQVGSANLSSGVAQISRTNLAVGAHDLQAVYVGTVNFTPSSSDVVTQTVSKASTTTSIVSSQNPSTSGQSVTFTASVGVVAPGGGVPTGSVRFYDGATLVRTVSLSAGLAQYATSALSAGTHQIQAVYVGNANYESSSSDAVAQQVN
jgi:uncharacterized delta-60 repeat protein